MKRRTFLEAVVAVVVAPIVVSKKRSRPPALEDYIEAYTTQGHYTQIGNTVFWHIRILARPLHSQ